MIPRLTNFLIRHRRIVIITIACLSAYVRTGCTQHCNSRYCIYSHRPNETLSSLDDAQNSCRNNGKESFLLEIYDSIVAELLFDFLNNDTKYWNHHVLLNVALKSTSHWFYVDDVTRTPKPYSFNTNDSWDEERNYMALVKVQSSDLKFDFRPSFGHELFPVICSRAAGEKECPDEKGFYANNLCHEVIRGAFTWFEAQNECTLSNSSLASLQGADPNDPLVSAHLTEPGYWVGITRHLWYWRESDSYVRFSRWFLDMPSQNNTNNCTYFVSHDNDNRWFRKNCQNDFAVLCMTDNLRASSQTSKVPGGVTTGIIIGVLASYWLS